MARAKKENGGQTENPYPKTVEQTYYERVRETDADKPRQEIRKEEHRKKKAVRKKMNRFGRFFIWAMVLLLAVLAGYGFAHTFCGEVTAAESSMEPTIAEGDTCLVNTAAYRFGRPSRGDLIVFTMPDDQTESRHVKRVVGLPGETVQIQNGRILIDGKTLTEEGDYPPVIDPGLAENPVTLADNEYFVLGDNRNGSEDSRYASVGNVRLANIIGRPWLRVRPIGKFGLIR